MRTVKMGKKTMELRANALALYYYEREFGTNLLDDYTSLQIMVEAFKEPEEGGRTEVDFSKFKMSEILRITYVLNKAAQKPGIPFPTFEEWLYETDIDMTDPTWFSAMAEEVAEGFFRSGLLAEPAAKPRSKSK